MKQLVAPRAPRPTSRRSGRRRHPRLGTMLAVVVAAVCAGAASGAVTTSLEPVAGSPLRRGVATTVLAMYQRFTGRETGWDTTCRRSKKLIMA